MKRATSFAGIALGLALVSGCATTPVAGPLAPPADPQPVDEWHAEPVVDRLARGNIVFLNHADPSIRADTAVELLQRQYDWLAEYVGIAPPWIRVHVGARYPSGFSTDVDGTPEVFLRSHAIFDTSIDYAHEMQHCFQGQFGRLPHWFGESLSDVVYADAEIYLWRRRDERAFLASFDRVDHRSYELMQLRTRFGRDYFRRVYAAMRARRAEFQAVTASGDLERVNALVLTVLSEAAGEDLEPLFRREFGFNPRTRERQRGY